MAFAPPLLAPPAPEVQDATDVAAAIDPQALGASQVLPPEPPPEASQGLPLDALMAASSAPPPALPSPVDAALAPALPPEGGPALSLLPPPEPLPGAPVPGAPATPAEAAKANVAATEAVGKEQVANAAEKAQLDAAAREEEAKAAAEKAQRLQALQDRQETHRQAAAHEVAAARAKAETEPFHTFWENRSIGQNIATGIGLILGGVSWNAGHVNRGVDMLNKAMELDLQLQKEKHADLWRAVNEAQEGQRTLDAEQLHELSAFSANEGAKHDALASRLMSAAAMNKGKGDVAAAKALAVKESAQAAKDWQNAETAAATANHLKELDAAKKLEDAERERYDKERNRIAEIRANKYKTKGGGHGGGGGGAREQAAVILMEKIAAAKAAGKPLGQADVDKMAVLGVDVPGHGKVKIPLIGKPSTINARQIMADAAKETAAASKATAADFKHEEALDARTVHWKGEDWIVGRANQVKDYAKDIANLEKYNDLIQEVASDIDKNGFIIDPGGEGNAQTEKGKRRMGLMAELQALGRQISALQATDAGQKLEHQMIGHAGVGLTPGIASSSVLRELGARANKLIDTKFHAALTPRKKLEGGGEAPDDAMRAAAERLTSGKSEGSDTAKAKAKAWLDAHPKKADITL